MSDVYAPLGSVSEATLRSADLIDAFSDMLDSLKDELITSGDESVKPDVERIDNLLGDIEQRGQVEGYWESEDPSFDVEALRDELDNFAPPYAYFGAHIGDGADFGFWPDVELVEQEIEVGALPKVSGTDELPAGYSGDVAIVNDHGNLTVGYYSAESDELTEYWAIV